MPQNTRRSLGSIGILDSFLATQWAAVKTHNSLTKTAPHNKCNPVLVFSASPTCQGHCPMRLALPFTMKGVFGESDRPHSERENKNHCHFMQLEFGRMNNFLVRGKIGTKR